MSELFPTLVPTAPLGEGEMVITSFTSDRTTYWRDMAVQAAGAMVLGMIALWMLDNPHIWTGAVGGLAAIAIRAFYLSSDELNVRWDLTTARLLGPADRIARLGDITRVRPFLSAVQVVTAQGDKYLIKYQVDRDAVVAALLAAQARPTDGTP